MAANAYAERGILFKAAGVKSAIWRYIGGKPSCFACFHTHWVYIWRKLKQSRNAAAVKAGSISVPMLIEEGKEMPDPGIINLQDLFMRPKAHWFVEQKNDSVDFLRVFLLLHHFDGLVDGRIG